MAPKAINDLRLFHLWVLDLVTDGYSVAYPHGDHAAGADDALLCERPALCGARWDH